MAKSLDYWRGYFSGPNSSIFDIIENALIVASLDHAEELKLRSVHIAELLYTFKLKKCLGCDSVKGSDGEKLMDVEKFSSSTSGEFEEESERRGKDCSVNCCGTGDDHGTNVSHGEVEVLKNEIAETEESQMIKNVFKVKELLDNHGEQSDSILIDLLRRLQLMDLSIEILEETKIGKSVSGLKNHGSKKIRDLARTLIKGWIALMDSWMNANATPTAIAENAAVIKKDELSDGIKARAEHKVNSEPKSQLKKDESAVQKKTSADEDHVSPPKHREQQSSNDALRKMPLPQQQEKGMPSDESSMQLKMEATKRKLQERYQEDKNAKKQRTIKVLELKDIPKSGARRNYLTKPGHYNHNRQGQTDIITCRN